MGKLKLAVVGCGAIVRAIHLPVIARSDQVEAAVLVDEVLPRARELADEHNVPAIADDHRDVVGQVDAAIVALPHYLHAPVTIDLLQRGIHVLVEKPMALKTSDCDETIEAASSAGVVLAVGLMRRFYRASQFVKQIIEDRMLGDIVSFDVREGSVYSWAPASSLMLQKGTGGGVVTGIGPHVLDLVLWWLGDYDHVEYYDDAVGGVEANCKLDLRLRCGASGVVELSRNRILRNSWIIRGERGSLEVGIGYNSPVRLETKSQGIVLTGQVTRNDAADTGLRDVFLRQLDDFADAIRGHREPFVPGQEGRRSVELTEACHAVRQPLQQPWVYLEGESHDSYAI